MLINLLDSPYASSKHSLILTLKAKYIHCPRVQQKGGKMFNWHCESFHCFSAFPKHLPQIRCCKISRTRVAQKPASRSEFQSPLKPLLVDAKAHTVVMMTNTDVSSPRGPPTTGRVQLWQCLVRGKCCVLVGAGTS